MSTVVVSLGGALVAALVSYLAAAKQFSGKIEDSSAAELWSESKSIREDYRDQIGQDREKIARLEGRVDALESTNIGLMRENAALIEQNRILSEARQACVQEIAELKAELARAKEKR